MNNKSMWKKYIVILIVCCAFSLAEGRELAGVASWISTEHCQSATNTWLMYRKVVQIKECPDSIVACIAVDSKYWLWINGRLVVFEGGLKRGPAPDATYYDIVELSSFLKKGENTIAVLVWHFGKDGFSHNNSGKAGLLFEAIASGVEIVSDGSWQCEIAEAYQNTESPYPNYRLPESNIRYDARLKIDGWNQPDYRGHMRGAEVIATAGGKPFGKLVQRPIPLWKDYGLRSYVSVKSSEKGDTLYCQLPYNCQVTPYLRIEARSGRTIRMQTDDYIGGGVENVRAEYITCDGEQEYESYGWMNGHTMIYVIPEGVKVLDVKFRETGYDTEFLGSFQCDDPFYNELWKRSIRTLYVTMRDTYMDCPDRERAQWWGDEVNELGETFYAFSSSSHQLAVKGIYELVNWQKENGVLFSPVPAGNWGKELPLQMLAAIGWYGFYTQYYYSGDTSFIADAYPAMHRYLHQVMALDAEGLVIERPGAWSWGDWGEHVDMGVLFNCWYYLALKAEKEFARILRKTEDEKMILLLMKGIEEHFDNRFWTGKAFRTLGYQGETDDRAQAMAVVSGLASSDKYPAIYETMRKEFHASPYMEKYVLEALFMMKNADFALQRMKERYAKMLKYEEHTTLFEGWGIGDEGFGGGTTNHAWSGGALTMLSQYVCGVMPTAPGFKSFVINPQLGSLRFVKATIPTDYGIIDLEIKREKGKKCMVVIVPEGISGQVVSDGKVVKRLSPGRQKVVLR